MIGRFIGSHLTFSVLLLGFLLIPDCFLHIVTSARLRRSYIVISLFYLLSHVSSYTSFISFRSNNLVFIFLFLLPTIFLAKWAARTLTGIRCFPMSNCSLPIAKAEVQLFGTFREQILDVCWETWISICREHHGQDGGENLEVEVWAVTKTALDRWRSGVWEAQNGADSADLQRFSGCTR